MYQVPHYIDNNKVFIVQRSEIEGRLEPEFYRPSIADLEKIIRGKSSHKLRDYALSVSGGATPKKTEGDKYYADNDKDAIIGALNKLRTDFTNYQRRLDTERKNIFLVEAKAAKGSAMTK